MKIRLTRLSNERHRLSVERDDGSGFERELETRSVLLHDLVHLAVESECGMHDGFWGCVAAGAEFDELLEEAARLGDGGRAGPGGLMLAESLVAPMQSVWHGRLDPERYIAIAREKAPFVDRPFVDRVLERIRKLWGHWRGTPFHATLELTWPEEETPALDRVRATARALERRGRE